MDSRAEEIYTRMESATLDGRTVNAIVGGSDPRNAGAAIVETLTRLDLLRPDLRILDLGCGCGRAAVAVAETLGGRLEYLGLDIIPGLISFCRKEISSRYPSCSFATLGGANPHYDRYIEAGERESGASANIGLDGRFDLVLAFSLFTHLRRRAALDSLRSIYRWTATGGSAVLSCFLLDPGSRRQIWRSQTPIFVAQRHRLKARAGIHVLVGGPSTAVAFDQALFTAMICDSGFDSVRSTHFGKWRCVEGLHYQDIVVLQKEEPFPADFDPAGYLEANPDVAKAGTHPYVHYRLHGRREGRRWRPET